MLCFRDMTFCDSDCSQSKCPRHFGAADRRAAKEWWGGEGAPIAWADYSDTCPDYRPRKRPEKK